MWRRRRNACNFEPRLDYVFWIIRQWIMQNWIHKPMFSCRGAKEGKDGERWERQQESFSTLLNRRGLVGRSENSLLFPPSQLGSSVQTRNRIFAYFTDLPSIVHLPLLVIIIYQLCAPVGWLVVVGCVILQYRTVCYVSYRFELSPTEK